MSKIIEENDWVWVVIMDPGEKEQFVGQQDDAEGISFIPAFLEKEAALKGLALLTREEGHRYEPQAIRFNDLSRQAKENGFMIFFLTEDGKVLEKIRPA